MIKVCLAKIKGSNKPEYFEVLPEIESGVVIGKYCIVETDRGQEFADINSLPKVLESDSSKPLPKVIRMATNEDILKNKDNLKKEEDAFKICFEKINDRQLPMKLVEAEYNFDASRVTFYFIADTRVDFKELVRDLSNVLKTRIEMKQIGVRDEAKMFGGCGPCGNKLCCVTFLKDFTPVSMRMAKDQNLALIPAKLSGMCGRLMCCLSFEHEFYKNTKKENKEDKENNGQ
jgi:cell fate regulator YaaT (PSP1 superfamily)